MLFPKNAKKSPIHENTNAKISRDFGDDRCRFASARLEKDIFVKNHLHTSPIVVKIYIYIYIVLVHFPVSMRVL